MWNLEKYKEFEECIKDLIACPQVQAMDQFRQHAQGVSCLDHCIYVSYISFSICKKMKLDYRAAARGALLHDMHLQDWEQNNQAWKKLFIHPKYALKNAEKFQLTDMEKDIIEKHMWPMTFRKMPRYRESFIVSTADKICACAEVLHIYRLTRADVKLVSLNKRRAFNS